MQPMQRRVSTTMANRRLPGWPFAAAAVVVSLIDLSPLDDVVLNSLMNRHTNHAKSGPVWKTLNTPLISFGKMELLEICKSHLCNEKVT
jgi:ABC-type uncharacterized transport system permease subunit